ncbi:restriction endonuclease subunit S, partial [Thauera sp. WH-2]
MSDKNNKTPKPGWRQVKFGEVVRLSKARSQDPMADGIERYVGLEHLEPGDLRIRSWGNVADGVTFTSVFQPGQVLFGKRRAYQRKVAVADFSGVCSGDIYVLETKDAQVLLPELLPFICQTDAFFDHAVGTSAGSLSPRTNWTSLADFEFALPPMDEQRRTLQVLQASYAVVDSYQSLISASELLWQSRTTDLFARGAAKETMPLGDL